LVILALQIDIPLDDDSLPDLGSTFQGDGVAFKRDGVRVEGKKIKVFLIF